MSLSSAPLAHASHMTSVANQAVMAQSPMSSSAIKMEPRGHGGFEDMSLPCNDHRRLLLHLHDTHGHAVSPTQRGPWLPPPQGLVTLQGASSILYSHQPSPPVLETPPQDRPRANAPPNPSLLPPPCALTGHMAAPEYARPPSQRGQEARAPPSVAGAGIDTPHDAAAASRHTQGPSLPQPQPPLHRYRQHVQGTDFPWGTVQLQRQNIVSIGPPPPSQTQKPQPPLSTRTRQAADGTAMAGMPNLLGAGRTQALSAVRFKLSLRQQPRAARACGFGDRDRRVIDPPPIVQLMIESSSMTEDEVRTYLRYESYVMNCAICDESGTRDALFMPEEYQHQRRLMGSLVGTPFVGRDEKGEEGCFFCFGDLSCRTPGAFRLKFTLIMIDPTRAGVIRHFPILTETLSEVFHVYSAKEFPGMLPSSNLAKRLKEQGCIISIKKGNDRSKNARSQGDLSDIDEDDGEGSQGQRKRRTTRD